MVHENIRGGAVGYVSHQLLSYVCPGCLRIITRYFATRRVRTKGKWFTYTHNSVVSGKPLDIEISFGLYLRYTAAPVKPVYMVVGQSSSSADIKFSYSYVGGTDEVFDIRYYLNLK